MIVRTSQDLLEIGCCECFPPNCVNPRKECQSISASVVSTGFFNPDDTEWIIYKKLGDRETIISSFNDDDGSITDSVNAFEYIFNEFAENFEGIIGDGEECKQWISESTPGCDSSGTKTTSFFTVTEEGDPEPYSRYVTTRSLLTGETEEHQQWEDDHPDFEQEYSDWEDDHAEWSTDHAAWSTAHAAWSTEWEAWDSGGRIGDEPVEPVEPTEPIEPDSEPPVNYPPCTWKDTRVFTLFIGDPPPDDVTTYDVGVDLSTIYSVYEEGETTYTYVPSYELPSNYETWVSETKAAIIADMDFDNPSCVDAGVCDPSFYVSKEPEEAPFDVDLSMNISKARYRFGIPLGYTRSVWVMQWDEAFFPDGHDDTIDDPGVTPPDPLPDGWTHPQIADPDAPPVELIASRNWTWAGDPEEPWSEWFEIAVPTEPGKTKPINVMTKCYASARLGVKPTSSGETYEIPEP